VLRASSYSGLITATVPHGDYTLTFALDNVPGEKWGKWISQLSLLLMVFWFWVERRKASTLLPPFVAKENA
jgi:hypothetical protein